jgi:trans-aconitate methyltransferase
MDGDSPLATRYYLEYAAALVRGKRSDAPAGPDEEVVRWGLAAGLRLHRFKRTGERLPRVRRVLGMLCGLAPADLLDVGTGRGVFLWPLLERFPALQVHAIDTRADRVADLRAVADGGITRLRPAEGDITCLAVDDDSVDGVTFLEVLEHLEEPGRALTEAVRIARRFVIVSVPSREDDNPEHIHLFSPATLCEHLRDTGAGRVSIDFVLNHMIALATVGGT